MEIVEGQLPSGRSWRVLITVPVGQQPGQSLRLAHALAKANDGEVVAAVVIDADSESLRARARESVAMLQAIDDGHAQTIFPVVVTAVDYENGLLQIVKQADIDLVLDDAQYLLRYNHKRLPCAVCVLRAVTDEQGVETGGTPVRRILVPTSGGPNTIHALTLLLPLVPDVEITALYIARRDLGENEQALGISRLRSVLNYVDADGRIESKLIEADNITEGIHRVAGEYDLVIIGASRESSLDKVLFGNIPDTIVRDSKRPVLVFREPKPRFGTVASEVGFFINRIIPRLSTKNRTETYVRIRRSARPSINFYVLITLSAMIAALGLMVNSPAVVIGAMLVAPLMSPIVGIGMAIVLGDVRFLRLSLGAVARGAALAIAVGMLAGLFFVGQELTSELDARTSPTLYDLGIALFSGMAGAYALSISAAAGALPGVAIAAALVPPLATVGVALVGGHFRDALGASLLFITNLVSISSATALTFLILGFRPAPANKERREVRSRSARVAIVSVLLVAGALLLTSGLLGASLRRQARIEEVITQHMLEEANAEVVSIRIVSFENGHLVVDVVARSTEPLLFQQAQDLQENIGAQLKGEGLIETIAMTFSIIRLTQLDPLVPPTPTETPTPTGTPTPGPTPTPTNTPTVTASSTATATAEATATATAVPSETPSPEPSATATPEPVTAVITSPFGLNLRAEPNFDSAVLAFLPVDSVVIVRDDQVIDGSRIWQQVEVDGQTGWVASEFLAQN